MTNLADKRCPDLVNKILGKIRVLLKITIKGLSD